jgi:hypothetical protein
MSRKRIQRSGYRHDPSGRDKNLRNNDLYTDEFAAYAAE